MKQKVALWRKVGVVLGVILIVLGVVRIWGTLNGGAVRLEPGYYGTSEVMEVDRAGYEGLLAAGKSFVVMVDNPGCVTTEKMRQMMTEFPEDLQFKYYRLMWLEARESSLHDYVNYFPSLVVVEKGKVKYYLRADSDEDAPYYNSAEKMQEWVRERVEF